MPPHGYIIIFSRSIILIYNLNVPKNTILSMLLGEELRKGEVVYLIIDLNLL